MEGEKEGSKGETDHTTDVKVQQGIWPRGKVVTSSTASNYKCPVLGLIQRIVGSQLEERTSISITYQKKKKRKRKRKRKMRKINKRMTE